MYAYRKDANLVHGPLSFSHLLTRKHSQMMPGIPLQRPISAMVAGEVVDYEIGLMLTMPVIPRAKVRNQNSP